MKYTAISLLLLIINLIYSIYYNTSSYVSDFHENMMIVAFIITLIYHAGMFFYFISKKNVKYLIHSGIIAIVYGFGFLNEIMILVSYGIIPVLAVLAVLAVITLYLLMTEYKKASEDEKKAVKQIYAVAVLVVVIISILYGFYSAVSWYRDPYRLTEKNLMRYGMCNEKNMDRFLEEGICLPLHMFKRIDTDTICKWYVNNTLYLCTHLRFEEWMIA